MRHSRKMLPMIEGGSLFDLEPIPGLLYRPDYIGATEAASLVTEIDKRPWSLELQRRRQWYGWAYDDTPQGDDGYRSDAMPDWLLPLARRLRADGYFDGEPDRALINEYLPGQGIGAHKDRDIERIRSVAIVSLGSGIMMEFARPGRAVRCQYLQPLSLVIMRGEAREAWTHGIVGRLNDKVGGVVMPRKRRLSLTFRFLNPEPSSPEPGRGEDRPAGRPGRG